MFAHYRADVAVMYRTEIDRHLFATASHRPRIRRRDREAMTERLRARWAERSARHRADEAAKAAR